MKLDWRQGMTSVVVGGCTAGVVSWLASRVVDNGHSVSVLAIGLGIGASRLVVSDKQ
ncbi:hypothetical protein [Sphingomonas sp. PP-CE-1G-424]|uniref:hypothetical protein n=1 Tax=Sphingomonas sp. PP-CE-1G-424 TaxID=2135658 RepID=UPI0010D2FB55|nr:hypothetical protein [Sphingomonas sp. PP-CE-1G-424]TCP71618.1 hypothetical protein C8J43_102699 [Sphingomonas sp. PP-CE-1G-424]